MKNKLKSRILLGVRDNFLSLFLFLCIMFFFFWGLAGAESGQDREALKTVENSILRAVVSCYAIEGRYPQNLEYIETNYGVRIDNEKYMVSYEIFASNIMPEITVQKREKNTA